jgi:hypothetical protein
MNPPSISFMLAGMVLALGARPPRPTESSASRRLVTFIWPGFHHRKHPSCPLPSTEIAVAAIVVDLLSSGDTLGTLAGLAHQATGQLTAEPRLPVLAAVGGLAAVELAMKTGPPLGYVFFLMETPHSCASFFSVRVLSIHGPENAKVWSSPFTSSIHELESGFSARSVVM